MADRLRYILIDTNLLKLITRGGNFKPTITWFEDHGLIESGKTQHIITAGGILEYLGIGTVALHLSKSFLNPEFQYIRNNSAEFSEIRKATGKILRAFTCEVYKQGTVDKTGLVARLTHEIQFVDETEKEYISRLIGNQIHKFPKRKGIANRIALDNLQTLRFTRDIKDAVFNSFILEIHIATTHQVTYNASRSAWILWVYFLHEYFVPALRITQKRIEAGELSETPGHLTIEQQIQNILDLENTAHIKNNKDILDTEALHQLVVGHFDEGAHRILFATCDPIKSILARVVLYKWFYIMTYQMIPMNEGTLPPMAEGKVVIFDQKTLKAQYIVEVSKLPTDLDFLVSVKLEDWLSEQIEACKITGLNNNMI